MKIIFKLKNQLIAFAYVLLVAVFFVGCDIFVEKEYTVEIIYCDSRPHKFVKIKSLDKPSNSQINTWKVAVPDWRGELNVCEIRILE